MSELNVMESNPVGLTALLPWQERMWQDLWQRIQKRNLPHALLLSGPEGVGKRYFAHYLALALLCHKNTPTGAPCGQCKPCQLNRASSHPDMMYLTTPAGKKNISIDQVREVIEKLNLKSQFNHGKVVILRPADELNHNSSNALLKTLEEPPEGTVMLLCSARPAFLPATIRSRCQQLSFLTPDPSAIQPWLSDHIDARALELVLRLAGNAPFLALQYSIMDLPRIREELFSSLESIVLQGVDPINIAAQWLKLGVKESLYCLHSWIVDIIRLRLVSDQAPVSNEDFRQRLAILGNKKSNKRLFHYLDKVEQNIRWLDEPLNQQLMLEDILIEWNR